MRFGDGYGSWTGGGRPGGGRHGASGPDGGRHDCGPHGGSWREGGRHGGTRQGSRSWGPFTVEWEIGGDDPRGGPRGRRRVFDGGELRLVLLKLAEDAPRHGYDLIRAIEERTGGAYAPSPGVVYPTLTLLEDMGLLDERKEEGARKLFAITEAGRQHLAEHADTVAALMARLDELGSHVRRADASPVRRAMHNLRNVLKGRLMRDDATPEQAHDIAGMIDDLARRVERL